MGVLKVTKKGLDFISKPHPVLLTKNHDFSDTDSDQDESNDQANSLGVGKSYDPVLYDLLKHERKKIARQRDLPPYVIIQDPSLQEMATTFPTTAEALANVNGIGMGKVKKFGEPFLKLVNKYVDDNEIDIEDVVVIKSSGRKSKNKIYIIQQIDRKIDLEEMADEKGWKMEQLLDEIEMICYSGTRLNLDYYIQQLMDDERQEDVADYFMNAESDNIEDAIAEFEDEDYSEEDLRLMRIKFLSEHAN